MKSLSLLSKSALFLVLISLSMVVSAKGWGVAPSDEIQPVVGETSGDVNFIPYEIFTGPCAGFPPIPDPLPPAEIPPPLANVQTVTTSAGVLKYIGRVVIETAHCAEGPYARDGTMIIHAVDGTIEGVYEAETLLVTPPPGPPFGIPETGGLVVQEGVYKITGGTGHYENVSGSLPFNVFVGVGEYGYAIDMTWSIRMAIAGHIQFPE